MDVKSTKFDFDVKKFIKKHYNIGEILKIKPLDSGFGSDNLKIYTEENIFVLRKIYRPEAVVRDGSQIYEFLSKNKFPVPMHFKTNEGYYYVQDPNKNYCSVLQGFIEGDEDISQTHADKLLGKFGTMFGRFHKTLSTIDVSKLSIIQDHYHRSVLENVRNVNLEFLFLPEDEYIRDQFGKWKKEVEIAPLHNLTRVIIHGDAGPGANILIKANEISGFIDLMETYEDYVLYDIASFMMYGNLYSPERKEYFVEFITHYLEEFPIPAINFEYLHLFLKTRFLIQCLYFAHRIQTGHTQGVENQKDNIHGLNDGKKFLKELEEIPHNFYSKENW